MPAPEPRPVYFQSEAGHPAPESVSPVGDDLRADVALARLKRGEHLLYTGDYRNARQLLSALKRKLRPRPPKPGADLRSRFIAERDQRANLHAVLSRLLVQLDERYRLENRSGQDVHDACVSAWGPPKGPVRVSLTELLGVIGAWEWKKRGVEVEGLPGRIHPDYGVFPPTRTDYTRLVFRAPGLQGKTVFDLGTGTGVLGFLALQKGAERVVATDLDPRAVACANANAQRLGFGPRFTAEQRDLFPDGLADVILFNPPWLPVTPRTPTDQAVYDPGGRLLQRYLDGLASHLKPGGEGWLVLSDLAERLGLRGAGELRKQFEAAGLKAVSTVELPPQHPGALDEDDPLYEARSAERVQLFTLRPVP